MLMDWVALGLENFSLSMFILATVGSFIHYLVMDVELHLTEIIYRWFAFFALGLPGIYTFITHVFFPGIAAAAIGWAESPFQLEVGMADLSFGLLGILSVRASTGFRLATVITATVMLWGDACGHIYQMITHHNFAPGNAGSWFWTDVLLPIVLIFCMVRLKAKQ